MADRTPRKRKVDLDDVPRNTEELTAGEAESVRGGALLLQGTKPKINSPIDHCPDPCSGDHLTSSQVAPH